MCCGKNSSSATCGHGAGIACMKEETKRIKGKEKKIQKRKMKKEKIEVENAIMEKTQERSDVSLPIIFRHRQQNNKYSPPICNKGRFSYLNKKSTTPPKKTKKNIRYQAAVKEKEKEKERRKYLWGDCGL